MADDKTTPAAASNQPSPDPELEGTTGRQKKYDGGPIPAGPSKDKKKK